MTKKKKTIFGTICYSPPAPSPSDCWKLWTVSRTFLRTAKWGGASAPVLGQWRTEQPYHTYPRLANGEPLPGSHDMPFCALPLLSTLNPGECGHHWRPDTGGIGRPLSSSELTRRYLKQTLSPSDEADHPVHENDPASAEEETFFPRLQTTGEAQGRDNNAQKLLKWIVSKAMFYFFLLLNLFLPLQKVVLIFIVYMRTTSVLNSWLHIVTFAPFAFCSFCLQSTEN